MREFIKGALILAVLAPFIFVLESFIYGAPQTVSRNAESVGATCRADGGGMAFCGCVAEDFKARLDVNAIAIRRLMFVRDTVPDRQRYYEEADAACRTQLK